MFKKLFSKYLPQIVAMLFLAGFLAYAWTEPASPPPGGNVEAPINVSSTTQYKAGALGIGGVLRGYADAIFDGKVGIGTTNPGAKLDVQGGDIKVGGTTIKGDGSVSINLNADKLDDKHAGDIQKGGLFGYCCRSYLASGNFPYCALAYPPAHISGGGGQPGYYNCWREPVWCSCPSGYTMIDLGGGPSDCAGYWPNTYGYSCYKQ